MTLQDYMKKRGLNARQFAALVGVNTSTVWRWLRGTIPSPHQMQRIGDVTKNRVKPGDFY